MIEKRTDLIVVGIDGSAHARRAAAWAAEVAASRSWTVRLVSVYEPFLQELPTRASPYDVIDPRGMSTNLLAEATALLSERTPQVRVETAAREGNITRVLLEEGAQGGALVLGRHGTGRFLDLLVGSTSSSCAARAATPVIVVPLDHQTAEPARRVVVGVDGSERGESALGFAFAEASARKADLTVVHAWQLPSPFGYELAAYRGRAEWEHQQRLVVAEVIAGWRQEYPDVLVETLLVEEHPAAALVGQSTHADLVVVGGRGHSPLTDMLIGSTPRAVVQHASCPVAVVHHVTSG